MKVGVFPHRGDGNISSSKIPRRSFFIEHLINSGGVGFELKLLGYFGMPRIIKKLGQKRVVVKRKI
jgi:hypothetical protein